MFSDSLIYFSRFCHFGKEYLILKGSFLENSFSHKRICLTICSDEILVSHTKMIRMDMLINPN